MGEQFQMKRERIARLDKQKTRNTHTVTEKGKRRVRVKKKRNFEVMEGRLETFKMSVLQFF